MKQIQRITGGLLVAAALLLWSASATAQCNNNDDCKGDRVCNAGACGPASCTKDTDCPGELVCQAGGTCAAAGGLGLRGSAAPPSAAPPSPATRTEKKRNKGLLIAGPIILGVAWLSTIGITAGVSLGTDSSRVGTNIAYAAIPVIGPIVLIADGDRDTDEFAAPLVLASLIQAGGLTMTILGITLTREVEVPAAALGEGTPMRHRLSLSPAAIGTSGAGLSLQMGRF